jgi:hypothetical protein
VTDRFGGQPSENAFAMLGDFNDYREDDNQGKSGILDLLNWDQIEPVAERLSADNQWTHYWAGGGAYKQLDRRLLSASLAAASTDQLDIMRKGQPKTREQVHRSPLRRGRPRPPKASDHCPSS